MSFILEDTKEIPAHKILLCRCPYFAAMFSNEMREKGQDKVKIENISSQIFLLILRYLYTDDCEITLEVINYYLSGLA
jgi:BTB/POZ domain